MTPEDYDTILEVGWPAFQAQFLNERIRPGLLEEFIAFLEKGPSVIEQVTAADMPYLCFAVIIQPFESLCGGRTFTQFILDLYRTPDKVEQVMQAMLPGMNDAAIAGAAALGSPGVWVGGWRSASRMLAQPLWDRFVWPYVTELVAQVDAAGLIPILHFDSDWTRDLPRLLELPAKKCILSLDSMTDIRKAKEILGDHMCIMGDVPPALLSSGTPEQVYEHCSKLDRRHRPDRLHPAVGLRHPRRRAARQRQGDGGRRRGRGELMTDAPGRPGGLTFIACPAVLGELADGATDGVDCRELEAQLHVSPERLKEALRAAVAEADVPGATIVLGYGLCSNSVLGLKTEHATLVVPRVDDCIAMLLGSNEAFSAESEKERGSYYVAKAYLEECDTIMSEHEKLVEKRGRERAERMMRLLLKHYTRIVLVDTGRYDLEPYRARVAEFAETLRPRRRGGARHDAHPGRARGGRSGATTSSSPLPATSSRSRTSGPSCSPAAPPRPRRADGDQPA